MSWSFLPELAAAFLEECCSGTDQSAPLNTTPTPDQFYWPDKPTEHSRLSRFGITCAPLTGVHGEELLTWYRAGFLARTSALPEAGQESKESAAVCGARWPGSLAKYDRDTCSWKTAQRSLLGDSEPSLVTWPRSGLMLDGQCWELPTLERRTEGSESGYWPTPNARDYKGAPGAGCVERGGRQSSLPQAVKTRTWPTATATAHKGWSPNHNRAMTDDRLDYSVEREAFQPGQQTPPMRLNPNWVEWLMGWPIGHTDLRPLEMDRFQGWWQQHGECSMYGEAEHG